MYMEVFMFYDIFKAVCKEKGTTVTTVLKEIGRSTGCTGKWSRGSYPALDIVMDMATHLGVSLDKLVYNREPLPASISESDQEWLDIICRIPAEKQEMCKDFLRTHMTVPEKYVDEKKA